MIRKELTACFNLISPMGQFHWRGVLQPGRLPGFHTGEDGDACYHTAVLCNALAWAYKNNPDPKDRETIKHEISRMLTFFEHGQTVRNGCLIRNIVTLEAYHSFIPQEKHCNKNFQLNDSPCMKYSLGSHYVHRYDISVDAVSQVMTACYWIGKFIPELRARCLLIVLMQEDYYRRTGWKILDEQGKLCRYGVHAPSILNPMAYFTVRLMSRMLSPNDRPSLGLTGWVLAKFFRTYISGVYLSKRTRKQFNNYMATMTLHALIDAGDDDFRSVLERLVGETAGEDNYYSNAVSNLVLGTSLPTIPPDTAMRGINYPGYIVSNEAVQLHSRYGWNYWESSPYRIGVGGVTGNYGQEDYIQALYLY